MSDQVTGIHHVTAIASDPQQNLNFYTGVLGLRLVKLTVNFDDPRSYHFYYGDGAGNPGTILTFFAWPGARRGRHGTGQIGITSFAVPGDGIAYWKDRLTQAGVEARAGERAGEEVLVFSDPDGMTLEIVPRSGIESLPGWANGPVDHGAAIRAIAGVTLNEAGFSDTVRLLDELGFSQAREEGQTYRYRVSGDPLGGAVDVHVVPNLPTGTVAVGSVHHVAWRVPDDGTQERMREGAVSAGYDVTPVLDREYFHSIYFREPGGVLFEIATDPPGFTVDESVEDLGTSLKLPAWYEPHRAEIARGLPRLLLPNGAEVGGS